MKNYGRLWPVTSDVFYNPGCLQDTVNKAIQGTINKASEFGFVTKAGNLTYCQLVPTTDMETSIDKETFPYVLIVQVEVNDDLEENFSYE